jgi:hypothetical protein
VGRILESVFVRWINVTLDLIKGLVALSRFITPVDQRMTCGRKYGSEVALEAYATKGRELYANAPREEVFW